MIGLISMLKNAIHMNPALQKSLNEKVKSRVFTCQRFMCDYWAPCCTVAICAPEPPAGARGLLQAAASYERVSTFCNRKCDHGVHPATDAKQGKKMLWGLKCHVNSWVQPLNTSGVLSTPFNAFKGQGLAQTWLCCCSPWWCERPQFPGTRPQQRQPAGPERERGEDCQEELLSWTAWQNLGHAVWKRKWVRLDRRSRLHISPRNRS